MKLKTACILILVNLLTKLSLTQIRGTLANSNHEGKPVKNVFFFTGNWQNGIQFYDYNPSNNTGLHSVHPSDARNLGWSENQANRNFVTDEMILRGFNVINMSYWGLPGSENWAFWAPMQKKTADKIYSVYFITE